MADIYIDESGDFSTHDPLFLIGAHLCHDTSDLDISIKRFEDELHSRVELEVYIDDYYKEGLHACSNHHTIKNIFLSYLHTADGQYAFAFTRKKVEHSIRIEYINIIAELTRTLILKVNKQGEVANIFYESAEKYLSGTTKDNDLLKAAIIHKNSKANVTVCGKDKEFKRLGFIDYACNIVYQNLKIVASNKSAETNKSAISQYRLIEGKTSFLWDIDNKKRLRPRKVNTKERKLAYWMKRD